MNRTRPDQDNDAASLTSGAGQCATVTTGGDRWKSALGQLKKYHADSLGERWKRLNIFSTGNFSRNIIRLHAKITEYKVVLQPHLRTSINNTYQFQSLFYVYFIAADLYLILFVKLLFLFFEKYFIIFIQKFDLTHAFQMGLTELVERNYTRCKLLRWDRGVARDAKQGSKVEDN